MIRAVGALAAAAAVVPGPAGAATVDVRPGGHALQAAIDHAHRGDVLRIHPGTYHESVLVDKRLTLRGVGAGRPVIDAGCHDNDTILVTHGGVTIEGLRVQGADEGFGEFPAEVFFTGTQTGTATDLRTIDTCAAEYGISAFATGPVKVTGNYGRGFDDSAIYIGTITDTRGGTLAVRDNTAVHNSRGVIVEDSPRATDIVVRRNDLSRNTIAGSEGPSDGLFLHNSQGIHVIGNTADDNGASGFHADVNSDHNVFRSNVANGNGVAPFTDEAGNHNCGSGNSFALPAC